jgi:hypothetical protein
MRCCHTGWLPNHEVHVMYLILIILLILVFAGGGYGYHTGWYAGRPYYGGGIGIVGLILVVLLVLLLVGRL